MLKFLRYLLSSSKTRTAASPELKHAQEQVAQILQLNLTTDAAREAHNDAVVDVLQSLAAEIEKVNQQANNYPAKQISALVWMNGAGYAELGQALTKHFRKAGWLQREENASSMWAAATLAVCSHYHHLVGPAMIAYADCHERLKNYPRAAELFRSVVQDFAYLVDAWPAQKRPNDEERIALESLQTATARLRARKLLAVDEIDLPRLQATLDTILQA